MAQNESSKRNLGLDRTAGADTDYGERTVFRFYFPCGEIDICQSIEFCHHNIDIVAAYSMRKGRNPLPMIKTGGKGKLTGLSLNLNRVEQGLEHFYPVGVAENYYIVGEVLRTHVNVECRAVGIDDKF